nr:MAG TPA: hypothetical protein [Caudoviricetes sp.]
MLITSLIMLSNSSSDSWSASLSACFCFSVRSSIGFFIFINT